MSAETVEAYVAGFPAEVREILQALRDTVLREAPGATESISYHIPTFRWRDEPLIYVAGWKKHVALYPAPEGDSGLAARVAPYVVSKGTVKFPLNKPVPYDLVADIVRHRVSQVAGEPTPPAPDPPPASAE